MANLNTEIDITKLRFVLYARKSTEDEGSQVNSIDDQIRHCMQYAENHNLRVVRIIKEENSAKKPIIALNLQKCYQSFRNDMTDFWRITQIA